jgi:carbon-monoxide dehydrogenase medium subunit
VKPAPFKYARATTVDEAVAALAEYGPEARILAGGQSLLQEMNLRQTRPTHLIDINAIESLDDIREEDGALVIGALARHRAVESSDVVRRVQPVLADAASQIAHFQVRNRGTLGGSLAQNNPGGEYGVVALLLDAEIRVVGPAGERTIPARDFFTGHYETALARDELVTEVRFPALPPGTRTAFDELTQRHGHLPFVSAAAAVRVEGGAVAEARLALGNVSKGVPVRVAAGDSLAGRELTDDVLDAFEQAVAAEVQPDLAADEAAAYVEGLGGVLGRRTMELAGEDYRRRVAGVLARRTVQTAYENAGR